MNILVHGAGALGAYFGGRLAEVGENVSFFVRDKRAAQLRKEGLHIHSPEGNMEIKDPVLFTSPDDITDIDLIILAVKGYHLDGVLPQLKQIQQNTGAFVLPLLNGMEHMPRLQEAVGAENVLGGFVAIIATLNEKGHVEHTNAKGSLKFGPIHEKQRGICRELADIGHRANTTIKQVDDITKEMWSKYIYITAFSGVTATTRLPHRFTLNNEATFAVSKNMIKEMAMLAEKDGTPYTEEEIQEIQDRLRKTPMDATSSMHQDLRKGLPIEVEHLHGGALRYAKKYNVSVPVVETVYGLLKPYENGAPE
ncbi:ketopantoate reductase family protein [Alteribacillus iranensis]|uniref:2-dehydropantoate 2-reductase n=1 Tax=Alteribacillus iranensis TaxID=930128 RepID=A0A1I2B8T4_9BACI|nr:2-dehydropantoate 2-reductase [Alteribacillus iranensis]SFE52479.1 ketopantoate reductase [Alteribacillus iranensis]